MVNWKVAVVLAAVLLAILAYALMTRPGPAKSPTNVVLLNCPPGEVVDMKVGDSTGKAVELARDASGSPWRVVSPVAGPADPGAVDSLTTAAYDLVPTSVVTSPPPASVLALDPPALTVACALRGGRSYTLSVGGQTFDGTGNYARSGGRIYVIPSTVVASFRSALTSPPVAPSPSPSGGPSPSPSA